jgi:spore germination protein YaaH
LNHSRENMDLLWELIKSAQEVGWHGARIKSEPTTEKFIEAYERQNRALLKIYNEMKKEDGR